MYKNDLESVKKRSLLICLEKPNKISEVCRCYLDILVRISYLWMKHSIQDLKKEQKPASPPSTPSDGNPSEYFKITLKLA